MRKKNVRVQCTVGAWRSGQIKKLPHKDFISSPIRTYNIRNHHENMQHTPLKQRILHLRHGKLLCEVYNLMSPPTYKIQNHNANTRLLLLKHDISPPLQVYKRCNYPASILLPYLNHSIYSTLRTYYI